MKKKIFNRLTSFLLASLMVVSLMPSGFSYAEGTSESTSEISTEAETEEITTSSVTEEITEKLMVEKTESAKEEKTEVKEKEKTEKESEEKKEEKTEEKTEAKTTEAAKEEIIPTFEKKYDGVDITDIDFSSCELLIATDDATVFTADTEVVSEYKGVFLTRYHDAETTRNAYTYYYDKVEMVDVNAVIKASDKESETVSSDNKEEKSESSDDEADPAQVKTTEQNTETTETNTEEAVKVETEIPNDGHGEADLSELNNGDDAISNIADAVEDVEAEVKEAEQKKEDNIYENAIALIDSGINDADKNKNIIKAESVIGDSEKDDNGHGTKMVESILSVNPDAEIVSIKALDKDAIGNVSDVYAAIQLAVAMKVKVINLSMSSTVTAESEILETAIEDAVKAGIAVVVSAGNNNKDAKYYTPANIEKAYTIGACDAGGKKVNVSNYGKSIDYYVVADSTSVAAAKFSALLVKDGVVINDISKNDIVFTSKEVDEYKEDTESTTETTTEATTEATDTDAIKKATDGDAIKLKADAINKDSFPDSFVISGKMDKNSTSANPRRTSEGYRIFDMYDVTYSELDSKYDVESTFFRCADPGKPLPHQGETFSIRVYRQEYDSSTKTCTYIASAPVQTSGSYDKQRVMASAILSLDEEEVWISLKKNITANNFVVNKPDFDGIMYKLRIGTSDDTSKAANYNVASFDVALNSEGYIKKIVTDNKVNSTNIIDGKTGSFKKTRKVKGTDGRDDYIKIGFDADPSKTYYVTFYEMKGPAATTSDGKPMVNGTYLAKSENDSNKSWYWNGGSVSNASVEKLKLGKTNTFTIKTNAITLGDDVAVHDVATVMIDKTVQGITNQDLSGAIYAVFTDKTDAQNATIDNYKSKASLVNCYDQNASKYINEITTDANGHGQMTIETDRYPYIENGQVLGTLGEFYIKELRTPTNSNIDADIKNDIQLDTKVYTVNIVPEFYKYYTSTKWYRKNNGEFGYTTKDVNWAPVFNWRYYTATYNLGFTNAQDAFNHFYEVGMNQGKRGSANFDVYEYDAWLQKYHPSIYESLHGPKSTLRDIYLEYCIYGANRGYPGRITTPTATEEARMINDNNFPSSLSIVHSVEPTSKWMYVKKGSANTSCTNGNPNYDLTGATYKVFKTRAEAQTALNTKNYSSAILTFTVDKNGNSTAQRIPGMIAAGSVFIVESKQGNKGYLRDTSVHEVPITINNSKDNPAKADVTDVPVRDPITLTIKKTDSTNGNTKSLNGTKFTIKFYAQDITGNLKTIDDLKNLTPNETIVLTTTEQADGSSAASINSHPFPRGYITIEETEVTGGYTKGQFKVYLNNESGKEISDNLIFISDHLIKADGTDDKAVTWYPNGAANYSQLTSGTGIELDSANFRLVTENTPIRGNIELTKVREDNDEPVEGVKFSITNVTTGEKHYIYTNKDGYATTKTDSYGEHFNYYDDKEDYDKDVTDATVFFIKNQDGKDSDVVPPDPKADELDALPYGVYTIKEERCAANKDFQLERPYSIAITVAGEMVTVYDEDAEETARKIYNVLKPNIHTTATVKETTVEPEAGANPEDEANIKSKSLAQEGSSIDYTNQTILDEVSYNKLRANSHYTLVSELMIVDKNGNVEPYKEKVGDEEVDYIRFKSFDTPVSYKKSIYNISDSVVCELDHVDPTGLEEEQKKLVVYESLYYDVDITKREEIPTGDAIKQYPEYEDIDEMDFFPLEHKDKNDTFQTVSPIDIHTSVLDNVSKDHIAHKDTNSTFTDHVYYTGLTPGKTYSMTGTIQVREDENWKKVTYDPKNSKANADGYVYSEELDPESKPVYTLRDADGNPIKAKPVEFTPTEPDGYVDIVFELDTTDLEGKEVVCFEELKYKDITLAVHTDIGDEDEIVRIPSFKTTTRNSLVPIIIEGKEDSAKEVPANNTASFTDVIHYTNLLANRTYKAKGTLYNKATGEPIKDAAGKVIEAEAEFTTPKVSAVASETHPDAKDFELADGTKMDMSSDHADYRVDGDAEVKFEGFDLTNCANLTGVVFEEIYMIVTDGDTTTEVPVGEHKDIDDVDQFISIIEVHTNATDQETGIKVVPEDSETTILDTVTYKHCIPGKKYKLVATLVAKGDKSGTYKDGDTIKNEDGTDVKVEFEFTPTTTDGEVVVPIKFNTKNLKSMQTVVFESMYNEYGLLVAAHNDLEDDNQRVFIPGGKTTAKDNATEDHVTRAEADITIIDTVHYESLNPGVEYTVTGVLYSKETKSPIKAGDKEITGSTTFTPKEPNGDVDIKFTLNTKYLKGATLVCFETMKYNDVTVFTHTDITSEAQSVHIPSIGTKATVDGKKEVSAVSTIELVDKVSYKNLVVDEEYELEAVLMDKESGKKLLVDGKPVTAKTKFKPDEPNGSVNVTFKFNASGLNGDVVAFETLLHNDVTIAKHKDIEDEDQTVTLKSSGKPKTGTPIVPLAVAGSVILVLLGIVIFLKKKNKITK